MIRATLAAAALFSAVMAGCGGGDDNGAAASEQTRQALLVMVLGKNDVPADLQSLGGSYSTNAEAAQGLGSGPSEQQLNDWGRILGYKEDFQAVAPSDESAINAVSTAVSLYKSDSGAADSFKDRVATARRVDWATSHSDLQQFQQEELNRNLPVDDSFWLHFTGFKEVSPGKTVLIADDEVVFRVGRAWGFEGIISRAAAGETDRSFFLAQVEALVLRQVSQMKTRLAAGGLD